MKVQQASIKSEDFCAYLHTVGSPKQSTSLVVSETARDHLVFDLWHDGVRQPEEIVLHASGTWAAKTKLTVRN
jgi:DNA-directed RNA polymerase alpha subunit